jgi:hypothetical protein
MPQPTRDEAIATLEEGYRAYTGLMANVGDEAMTSPATIGGGDWSAKDLLGHLTWWEEIALATLEEWRSGRRPWIEEVFRSGGDAGDRVNAEDLDRKAPMTVADVRALAADVHGTLIAKLAAIADQRWRERAPYPAEQRTRLGVLLGSVLGAPKRPFGHAWAHLPDLEAFVATLG